MSPTASSKVFPGNSGTIVYSGHAGCLVSAIGIIKGDTKGLDYGSDEFFQERLLGDAAKNQAGQRRDGFSL